MSGERPRGARRSPRETTGISLIGLRRGRVALHALAFTQSWSPPVLDITYLMGGPGSAPAVPSSDQAEPVGDFESFQAPPRASQMKAPASGRAPARSAAPGGGGRPDSSARSGRR